MDKEGAVVGIRRNFQRLFDEKLNTSELPYTMVYSSYTIQDSDKSNYYLGVDDDGALTIVSTSAVSVNPYLFFSTYRADSTYRILATTDTAVDATELSFTFRANDLLVLDKSGDTVFLMGIDSDGAIDVTEAGDMP